MSRRFGWCLDGYHEPPTEGPGAYGCPGRIGGPHGIACGCPCHDEREG